MVRFLILLLVLLFGGLAVAGNAEVQARVREALAVVRPAQTPAATGTRVPEAVSPGRAPGTSGSVSSRAPGDVTVELDEATLTREANSNLVGQPIAETPLGTATLRQVAVQLQNGQITASGAAQMGPTTVPVDVVATAQAQGGKVQVTVTSARVGGVPVPPAARQQIEQLLQAQIDQAVAAQSVRVKSVAIGGGKLTVVGGRV